MTRKDLTINGDGSSGKKELTTPPEIYIQKPTDEKCAHSTKLQDLNKENSFDTTTTEFDVGPSKTQSCCGLVCLSLALGCSIFGCYIMWGTDLFTMFVHQNVVISNNSMRYEAWKSPPVHALLRVYIFNFTNVNEFESGVDSKLKIQELGPYTYIEKLERIDVTFNKNGTASYRDKKTYKFSPEHSQGNESDVIIVPNLPFLATMSFMTEMSSLLRWTLRSALKSIGGEPFISVQAGDFLWGYEDRLSVLVQKILSLRYDLPFKKFGILSAKNQTQKDLVTIYTGEEDPSKTGVVATYNGKTSLNYWNSQECNRIDGTDGTVYPPPLVHPNSTLYIYSKDFCRKMPLIYNKQYLDKHGIPVLRFQIPKTVFTSGDEQKDNLCYCSQSRSGLKCLPSGIFNVGPCAYEAPVVTSLPHFLYGDPILSTRIEGFSPNAKKHQSYIEVDPKMGIPVGGKSRFQLNILLNGEFGSPLRNHLYKNQVVFPITWMDYGVDRLPDEISAMIRSLLSFIKVAEFALSYGFIAATVVLSIFFASGCRQVLKSRRLPLRGETPLVLLREKS